MFWNCGTVAAIAHSSSLAPCSVKRTALPLRPLPAVDGIQPAALITPPPNAEADAERSGDDDGQPASSKRLYRSLPCSCWRSSAVVASSTWLGSKRLCLSRPPTGFRRGPCQSLTVHDSQAESPPRRGLLPASTCKKSARLRPAICQRHCHPVPGQGAVLRVLSQAISEAAAGCGPRHRSCGLCPPVTGLCARVQGDVSLQEKAEVAAGHRHH